MTDKPVTGFRAKIPNILTIGRIVLIPVLIWGILALKTDVFSESHYSPNGYLILALFLGLALSDFLDGYLARKWNVTSDFGRMIDPIADKLFVAGCLIAICIVANGLWLVLIPALMIIGRDIFVSGIREFAALRSRAMPPTKLAKWKTACEMLAVAIFIFVLAYNSQTENSIVRYIQLEETPFLTRMSVSEKLTYAGTAFLWLAAILSVYTGSLYLRAALKD